MGQDLNYSNFLYADPSFFEGLARIWDFGNALSHTNTSPNGEVADFIAIAADYAAVGNDVYQSLAAHDANVLKASDQIAIAFPD